MKPHISVTIDYDALKTATANATGELVFGDTLSAATVRRLACDAEVLPIVLGSKSQPLDVGTSQRLVTRPMRRALNARDKGCVVCGAPPIQCEAHHLKHWIDGGITAVSNLVLLCKRHHLDLHSGHWTIRIIDGVVQVTRPAWADPGLVPRGRYRPPLWSAPAPEEFEGGGVAPLPVNSDVGSDRAGNRRLSVVDAVCQDPWGDDADTGDRPSPARPAATVPVIPWADDPPPAGCSTAEDVVRSVAEEAAVFDPWGEGVVQDVGVGGGDSSRVVAEESAAFDPWGGDVVPYVGVGVGGGESSRVVAGGGAAFDPWGDGAVADRGLGAADRVRVAAAEVAETAGDDAWGGGQASGSGAPQPGDQLRPATEPGLGTVA